MSSLTEAALKATNEWAISADWQQNLAIANRCTGVLESESVLHVVLQRLEDANPDVNMRALELLQACMQNSFPMVQALHKSSAQTNLRKVVDRMKDYRVKNKLLNMIRAWGEAYEGDRNLPNFQATLLNLQMANVPFPGKDDDSNYSKPSPPAAARMYDSRPSRSRRGVAAMAQQMPAATPVYQQPVYAPPVQAQQYSQYPAAGMAQANQHQPQPYPSPHAAPQQRPPQPQQPQQLARPTIPRMNEMLSSQSLLKEVLSAMQPGKESPEQNDLVQDLRNACETTRKAILASIESEQNEALLMLMLQFNDSVVELDTIYADLVHAYKNTPRAPQGSPQPPPSAPAVAPAVASAPPQSRLGGSLGGGGGMVNLDLDVESLLPQAPTTTSSAQPWLPIGDSGEDLSIHAPTAGSRTAAQRTAQQAPQPQPQVPAQQPAVDLLSLASPPPAAKADDDFDDFFDQIATRDRSKSGTATSFASQASPAPVSSQGSADLLSSPPSSASNTAVSPSAGLLDILSQPLSPSAPAPQQPMGRGMGMGMGTMAGMQPQQGMGMGMGMGSMGMQPQQPQQYPVQPQYGLQPQLQQPQQPQQPQQQQGFLQSQFGNMRLQ